MNFHLNNECIEEVNFNCPFKITTPAGITENFNITNLKWSFTKPSFILITIHPVNSKGKVSTLEIASNRLLREQVSEVLDKYAEEPESHITQFQLNILGELADSSIKKIE